MDATTISVIGVLQALQATTDFVNIVQMNASVKYGDPGIVVTDEYPYMFVHPMSMERKTSTMGVTGSDNRLINLRVGICLLAADYFDETVNELPGYRTLVKAATAVQDELLRLSNRTLNQTVTNLIVPVLELVPEQRGADFTTMAYLTVVVEKKYNHKA